MSGLVLVVVPTFRRPVWAAELLTQLGAQLDDVARGGHLAEVLVLDNAPEASAAGLAGHPLVAAGRATYEHLGAGDVVSVRNAALDRARARDAAYLVLLDDDELPRPGWLAALLATRERWAAGVVAGPVRQEPEALARPYARALLERTEREEGPLTGDLGTGNVLLDVGLLRRTGVLFDPRLGRIGGEDTLFFRQLARCGAVLAWSPDAVVVERAEPGRLGRAALLRRSYDNGRSSRVVDEALGGATGPLRRAAVVVGAAGVHLPAAAVHAVCGDRVGAWRRVLKVVRHAGRLGPARPGRGRYGGGHDGMTP